MNITRPKWLTTARNSLDSGSAQAATDFDSHIEPEYRRDEMRRYNNARATYEPPAAPDVEFPQGVSYLNDQNNA